MIATIPVPVKGLYINPGLRYMGNMNDYQKEQLEALQIVRKGWDDLREEKRQSVLDETREYMRFRRSVDAFLNRYFSRVCTQTCYQSQTSACCSKDGIITFFADTVINTIHATAEQLDQLECLLTASHTGHRCVYLGDDGCLWTVRPIVCAMFLCDRAMDNVFAGNPEARHLWDSLRIQEKTFKWPDRPVLFDYLEKVFLDMGYRSSLMHLNFSPGLLNVKKKANLYSRQFR